MLAARVHGVPGEGYWHASGRVDEEVHDWLSLGGQGAPIGFGHQALGAGPHQALERAGVEARMGFNQRDIGFDAGRKPGFGFFPGPGVGFEPDFVFNGSKEAIAGRHEGVVVGVGNLDAAGAAKDFPVKDYNRFAEARVRGDLDRVDGVPLRIRANLVRRVLGSGQDDGFAGAL